MAKINKSGTQSQVPKLFQTKVDSTLLSIPLDKCEIIDTSLIDIVATLKINTTTGETISQVNKAGEPYVRRYNGISFKIWVDYQFDYIEGIRERIPYISFLANSKQFEGAYFGGITKHTYRDYYNEIMQLEVFKCDYDSFKGARFSDTDICFDFKATDKEFEVLKGSLKRSFANTSLIHTSDIETNSGIWAPAKREPRKQATPKHPYIKFYSKDKDFKYNSKEFASSYIDTDTTDLVRFEATIRNAKHKDRLGIPKGITFFEFLNLDLTTFCSAMINQYINKPKFIKATGISPTDQCLINLINEVIRLGGSKMDVYNVFDLTPYTTNRSTIARYLAKHYELMNYEQINKDKLEANSLTTDVFEFLGITK